MIRILILYLVIIFISNSSTFAQEKIFTFTETKTDTINKKFKSILLIGIGSTPTRIFLDKLKDVLIKKLNSEKIKSDYYYLGRDDDTLSKPFDTLLTRNYDAILVFSPKDSSIFKTISKNKGNLSLLNLLGLYTVGQIRSKSLSISYQQSFNLSLYLQENKSESIWDANLDVNFGMGGLSNYQNISNKIYWRLKAHKYVK